MDFRSAHFASLCLSIGLSVPASAQQSQIDLARQFDASDPVRNIRDIQAAPVAPSLPQSEGGQDFDSFGVQQMLVCGPERARYFRTFGEISGFVTGNVGLSRRDPHSDSFLVGTFGLDYRRPLKRGFQVDAGFQVAMFRYNEFRQLDFNSLDVGVGLTYQWKKFGGVDLSARYNFNSLHAASSGDTLFENHTITAAVEKIFQFGKAHYALLGVSGRLGFADPKANERHEVAVYTGYHIEVVPRLDVDLGYRYACYAYTEGNRRDHNQTASLALRYRMKDWCSASASSFYVWDHSNLDALGYSAGSVGTALMLMFRF